MCCCRLYWMVGLILLVRWFGICSGCFCASLLVVGLLNGFILMMMFLMGWVRFLFCLLRGGRIVLWCVVVCVTWMGFGGILSLW